MSFGWVCTRLWCSTCCISNIRTCCPSSIQKTSHLWLISNWMYTILICSSLPQFHACSRRSCRHFGILQTIGQEVQICIVFDITKYSHFHGPEWCLPQAVVEFSHGFCFKPGRKVLFYLHQYIIWCTHYDQVINIHNSCYGHKSMDQHHCVWTQVTLNTHVIHCSNSVGMALVHTMTYKLHTRVSSPGEINPSDCSMKIPLLREPLRNTWC